MHTHPFPAQHVRLKHGRVSVAILALLLIPLGLVWAQGTPGSNTQPLAFGPDQVIIDLNKLVWVPLKAEGVPPGPEMAVLRGDGKARALKSWCDCQPVTRSRTTVTRATNTTSG